MSKLMNPARDPHLLEDVVLGGGTRRVLGGGLAGAGLLLAAGADGPDGGLGVVPQREVRRVVGVHPALLLLLLLLLLL